MGKAINQFRRICPAQSAVLLSPSEISSATCSSISVTETAGNEEPGFSSHAEQLVHDNCAKDGDKDAYICETNANDHYRPCKDRAAHYSVLN